LAAGLEPLPALRYCGRLGGSSWRGFAQQAAGTEAEQEPGTSSKAEAEDTGESTTKEAGEKDASEASEAEAKTEAGSDEAAKDAGEEPAAEAEEKELSPIERLQQDLEDFQEKSRGKKKELLLGLADFQNTQKKFNKERESRRRTASTNFARRMVDVYREFEAMPELQATSEKEEGSACAALQEGVSLTRDLFAVALEKGNVERIPVELGTPVVNARHEVVGSAPGDGSLPESSIAEVSEDGWILDLRSQMPQVVHKAKVKTVGSE